jgi:hypothetical protein
VWGTGHLYHSKAMPVNIVRIARNGTRYCYDGLGRLMSRGRGFSDGASAVGDVILGAIPYWKTELDISASAGASGARRGPPCLSDGSFAAAEDARLGHCRGRDLVRPQAR